MNPISRVSTEPSTVQSRLRGTAGEPQLEYGLNSLLDRAADQDCHIHLPAQDWIHQTFATVWSTPGAEVTSEVLGKREVDVLALSRRELIVAEVKSSVAGMTDDAVRKAAELAHQLGIDRLVLAVIDIWPQTERPTEAALGSPRSLKLTTVDLSDLAKLQR